MSEKGLTRRDFLASAGTFAASALASGGVLGAIAPAVAMAAPALPWPYVTLDANAVAKSAYDAYKVGGCMYGTGAALINALAASAGTPWDTFNPDLFKFGGGGVQSWGTLCGSLNASAAVVQMVTPTNAAAILNELYGWYCNCPFPSTRMDAYSLYPNQPTSLSKSPLCHQSAGIWAYTYNFKIGSAERKERCAKVASDVAYQTVEYLNAWKAGNFTPTLAAPDYQSDTNFERCFTCHVGVGSKYDNAQGKMNCLQSGCHEDKATHKL